MVSALLNEILKSRNINHIEPNYPLWKLRLSAKEYQDLKDLLGNHRYYLSAYGFEAALCYAEWWHRDFAGGVPSKEMVASGIGLAPQFAEALFRSAKEALQKLNYTFIRPNQNTQYFRTLLNQGGLPLWCIKESHNNFTYFLKRLVDELSVVQCDWDHWGSSIVTDLGLQIYLPQTCRNDNIYDVALLIARAIIEGDNTLLPYDESDQSLRELTNALRKEYDILRNNSRPRSLLLDWQLELYAEERSEAPSADCGATAASRRARLSVSFESPREIPAESLPGIDTHTCDSFNIILEGVVVSKYIRKTVRPTDAADGERRVVYTRISATNGKNLPWKGAPIVELKIRCSNGENLFLTIAGSNAPNFEYPMVFRRNADGKYMRRCTRDATDNIAVFGPDWRTPQSQPLEIVSRQSTDSPQELFMEHFTQSLTLTNSATGETETLENRYSEYSVEFSGTYLGWLERANYKLIKSVPTIVVYDSNGRRISNCTQSYRLRSGEDMRWRPLQRNTHLPFGVVDICVLLPDNQKVVESFYCINDLSIDSRNATTSSVELEVTGSGDCRCTIEQIPGAKIETLATSSWRITRGSDHHLCPSQCWFHIYNPGNPTLKIAVAIPFKGVVAIDAAGRILPHKKIVSYNNLTSFFILAHGQSRKLRVSYVADQIAEQARIYSYWVNLPEGISSLAEYKPLIERIFNIYGVRSFNRNSYATLTLGNRTLYIRKFVLDSRFDNPAEDGQLQTIHLIDNTEGADTEFVYNGDIYALPVGRDIDPSDTVEPTKLLRNPLVPNGFVFPDHFNHNEAILFSGAHDRRRIVPKYFNRTRVDNTREERAKITQENIAIWRERLANENILLGKAWREVANAFSVCCRFKLPMTTHNGLKVMSGNPFLLAKFVTAIWQSGTESRDLLIENIERLETELEVALHWIPLRLWSEAIGDMFGGLPELMSQLIGPKLPDLTNFIQDLFYSTSTPEMAQELTAIIAQNLIATEQPLTVREVSAYSEQINAFLDHNQGLPSERFNIRGHYYPRDRQMRFEYRVMMEAAMCAAENARDVANATNLFSLDNKSHARLVNFYRTYFKDVYCSIFMRALKCR